MASDFTKPDRIHTLFPDEIAKKMWPLPVDDFLQNDGRTESFLRKIISMAEEEVGYKVQGGNITIQVAVLPEHTLALTFSEKSELGISNMLENLLLK